MKKVIVLAILFLFSVSINHAQSYAGVYSLHNNGIEKSKENKNTPEIVKKSVYIKGSTYEPEITGLSLTPTAASETVELMIESKEQKSFKVSLFNQLGTEINNFEVPSNKLNTININQYASGSYYFLVHISDGTIKKKFEILK